MSLRVVTPKHHLPISEDEKYYEVSLVNKNAEVMLKDIESKETPGILFDIVAVQTAHGREPKFMPNSIRYPKTNFSLQDIYGLEDNLVEKRNFCPRCKSLDDALHMLYNARRARDMAVNRNPKPVELPKHSPPDIKVKSDFKNTQPGDLPNEVIDKFNTSLEHTVNKLQSDLADFVTDFNDRLLNPFRLK